MTGKGFSMMYYGWWMPFGGLFMVAIVGLIVWAVIAATRPSRSVGERPSALDVLDDRFARGELDEEEYRTRRATIERSGR